jgi:hypothetical protein
MASTCQLSQPSLEGGILSPSFGEIARGCHYQVMIEILIAHQTPLCTP